MPDAPFSHATLVATRFDPETGPLLLDARLDGDGTVLHFAHAAVNVPMEEPQIAGPDGGVLEAATLPGPPGTLTSRVSGHGPLTITAAGQSRTVSPAFADPDPLADRNVLLTVGPTPDPEALHIWLTHHVDCHGADAALWLRRLEQDEDAEAALPALAEVAGRVEGLAHLMILDAAVPLGHPAQPDARLALAAPDAPGKVRLPPAPPDPWRSPLGQAGVFEIARSRALGRARAVLRLDPEDFLLPPQEDGQTVFDAALACGSYLKFRGVRAYPWQIAGDQATLHDHACRRFDGAAAESIWCAPGTLGGRWRPYRAAIRPPDPASAQFSFVRMMGLRHPDLSAAQLAPKSSLIADQRVGNLVTHLTGSRPVQPPQPAEPSRALRNDRVLIITTMKNEGPFLLEWLAYHRAIGVTDMLVYTNDCADGTDAMFDALARRGLVEHRQNPYRRTGEKPQHAALADAQTSAIAQAADWVICMDVDEYINVHAGDGHLRDLFAAVPDATMIALTWRLFGNADVDTYADRWITEQFIRCAPQLVRKPHQAWGFKTLFRPLPHYKKFGVHRPKGLRPEYIDAIRFVNGSGAPMPAPYLRTGWRSSLSNYGYDLVTLNHYALRSAESFLVKRDRGRVNHVDRDQGLTYWFRMNHNAETDRSILARLPAARAEYADLMADPEIAQLHARAVAWHRDRITKLKTQPDYAALHGEITGTRLRQLSTQLHRFGSRVFLQGPDVIPADFDLHGDGTVAG